MKVLLDTNILLSAALFPNGIAAQAYIKAVTFPNNGIVCEWSINELKNVFIRKFPDKLQALDIFLSISFTAFDIIPTPTQEVSDEGKIRDINDRPLLRAAQINQVDILLTGDKDFLESSITNPLILNPTQFLELNK